MFNKSILLSIIFCSSLLVAQGHVGRGGGPAMGKISGVVVDSLTSQEIAYASVSVINMKTNDIVTGAITDESGYFIINGISFGRFLIRVEFIVLLKSAQ